MIDDIIHLQFSHENVESIIKPNSKFLNFHPSSKSTLRHIIRGNYKNMELIQLEDIFDLDCESHDPKDDENADENEDAMIVILSKEMDGYQNKEYTNENQRMMNTSWKIICQLVY